MLKNFRLFEFEMIESGAYFESYVHVLSKIQLMNKTWTNLPFEDQIVKGLVNNQMPLYMRNLRESRFRNAMFTNFT